MSCLRPKRFSNPIKDYKRTQFDKYTIQGNCGSCYGCNKKKQNDWLVRGYFEYISKPTESFFVSLDFDEQHLPRYKGTPCFDSVLMTSFFEVLRQVVPPFRYLYSSHYGEAMNRPHYHVCFFFDKGSIDLETFFSAITKYWKYGSHQNIQKLRSVRDNPLAAVEYVCKYTTRDTRYCNIAKRMNMPNRYRPVTQASIGFGAQALDPSEFRSDRLIKQGVKFLDRPVITKEYLRNNSFVYLDIKNNGFLVRFAIPMYYEYKLTYSSSWDPVEKKTILQKNDLALELQKIRHNCHYIQLFDEFVHSVDLPIHKDYYTSMVFNKTFPESPYNGMVWKDIVLDVLQDRSKFFNFCKYYSWLEFDMRDYGFKRYRPRKFYSRQFSHRDDELSGHYYIHSSVGLSDCSSLFEFEDSSIDLFIQALSYYIIWKQVGNFRKAELEDFKAQEQVKVKIKERCKSQPSFYWHLKRSGFNFSKLYPSKYVSRYQIAKD